MLLELDIENFAIARRVQLRFSDGLTAISGETGAGKSILLDALALLLGAKTGSEAVRQGSEAARVTGVFVLDDVDEGLQTQLEEHGLATDDDGLLVVSRAVPAAGRSLARVNGRVATQSALAAIGGRLVDLHGQTDHLALLRPAEHMAAVDAYAGVRADRDAMAESVGRLRAVRAELRRDGLDERERARTIDRLMYEIGEIEAVAPRPGEEETLTEERAVLAAAEELTRLAAEARAALAEGATDAVGVAAAAAEAIARVDGRFETNAREIAALQDAIAEAARAARDYGESVEVDPERLQVVEARLISLKELCRKYGPTIDDALAYADRARAQLAELSSADEREAELRDEEARLVGECGLLARSLTTARRAAIPALSGAVQVELADLGLPHAKFGARLGRRRDADGLPLDMPAFETIGSDGTVDAGQPLDRVAFSQAGIDEIEFVVAMNPGDPLRPLAKVASGGETSRLVLALKTVLREHDPVPTLVFDEVEAGLGARSGGVVGRKLAAIARGRQVLCITHLAQVAAWADAHLVVRKSVETGRAEVEVGPVDGEDRLVELAEMLGGDSPQNRESARALVADRADPIAGSGR